MNHPNLLLVVLVAMLCACQRGTATDDASSAPDNTASASAGNTTTTAPVQDPENVRSSVPSIVEMPPGNAPTPGIAEGAEIIYTCDDGSELRVRYAGAIARILASDGAYLQVSRIGAADSGETYADKGTSLHRLSNVVEITQDNVKRRCSESGGNA